MLRKIITVFLVATISLSVCACSQSGEESMENPESSSAPPVETASNSQEKDISSGFPEMTLVYTETQAENSDDSNCLKEMAQTINEMTDGNVTIELHFNGELVPQAQQVSQTMAGNVDMCSEDFPYLAEYMPELGMFDAAYLYKDIDHWRAWFESDKWNEIVEQVAEKMGVRIIAPYCYGFRVMNLRDDKKIMSREDLKGVKLRVINNETSIFKGEAFGANPVGLSFNDIYLGLQTGTVDGQENPLWLIESGSFNEVTKSITETNHVLATSLVLINEEKWQSFSPELQKIISDAVKKYCDDAYQCVVDNDARIKAEFVEKGMKIYDLTDEERSAYRQEVLDYYFSPAGDTQRADWNMEWYDLVQTYAD